MKRSEKNNSPDFNIRTLTIKISPTLGEDCRNSEK
jgi:hypothetical protein